MCPHEREAFPSERRRQLGGAAVLMGLRNQRSKPGHYLMDKIHDALEDFQVAQARNRNEQVKGCRKVRVEHDSKTGA